MDVNRKKGLFSYYLAKDSISNLGKPMPEIFGVKLIFNLSNTLTVWSIAAGPRPYLDQEQPAFQGGQLGRSSRPLVLEYPL